VRLLVPSPVLAVNGPPLVSNVSTGKRFGVRPGLPFRLSILLTNKIGVGRRSCGRVAEWLIALVLKTSKG
jgi:hypothetical protein